MSILRRPEAAGETCLVVKGSPRFESGRRLLFLSQISASHASAERRVSRLASSWREPRKGTRDLRRDGSVRGRSAFADSRLRQTYSPSCPDRPDGVDVVVPADASGRRVGSAAVSSSPADVSPSHTARHASSGIEPDHAAEETAALSTELRGRFLFARRIFKIWTRRSVSGGLPALVTDVVSPSCGRGGRGRDRRLGRA